MHDARLAGAAAVVGQHATTVGDRAATVLVGDAGQSTPSVRIGLLEPVDRAPLSWHYGQGVHSEELRIETGSQERVHDLTTDCAAFLSRTRAGDGLLNVWVPHATAGLAIIETGVGSDQDLLRALRELLPPDDRWSHRHGAPGHGRDHLLPALLPPFATVPVVAGRMTLGTWQSVCLVDTNADNRVRTVRLSFLGG